MHDSPKLKDMVFQRKKERKSRVLEKAKPKETVAGDAAGEKDAEGI